MLHYLLTNDHVCLARLARLHGIKTRLHVIVLIHVLLSVMLINGHCLLVLVTDMVFSDFAFGIQMLFILFLLMTHFFSLPVV